MIQWAGIRSEDVGMVVEHYPDIIVPKHKQEIQKVPGRNGDIILFQDAYENYDQSYQVFIDADKSGGLQKVMPKISDWLLGHPGYQRLEDSYFPDVWRKAYYTGGVELINFLGIYGEGTLTFNCAPEKYFKTGEKPIQISNGQILINPTLFSAQPMIRILGNGENTTLSLQPLKSNQVTPAGTARTVTFSVLRGGVVVDTRTHQAYNENDSTMTNRNNTVIGRFEDLELTGGPTRISWYPTANVTEVTIWPRWWTL